MATKKQKRLAGEERAKQEAFERVQSGLAAQKRDREERERQELTAWQPQHEKKHSWKKRIKECPHCRIELAANKAAQTNPTKESA